MLAGRKGGRDADGAFNIHVMFCGSVEAVMMLLKPLHIWLNESTVLGG